MMVPGESIGAADLDLGTRPAAAPSRLPAPDSAPSPSRLQATQDSPRSNPGA